MEALDHYLEKFFVRFALRILQAIYVQQKIKEITSIKIKKKENVY